MPYKFNMLRKNDNIRTEDFWIFKIIFDYCNKYLIKNILVKKKKFFFYSHTGDISR